jgi:ATP-dependent DNA helicase RecQ
MENSVSKAIEKAQQFSGYLELKKYQRQTIDDFVFDAYLSGRDVFVSAQTGYGKLSLTFELAPHAFEYLSENNKSLVLVVVPLVSLMKDQVNNLVSRGIPSSYIGDDCFAKRSDKYAARAIK